MFTVEPPMGFLLTTNSLYYSKVCLCEFLIKSCRMFPAVCLTTKKIAVKTPFLCQFRKLIQPRRRRRWSTVHARLPHCLHTICVLKLCHRGWPKALHNMHRISHDCSRCSFGSNPCLSYMVRLYFKPCFASLAFY